MRKIESPVERWPGYIGIPDPITYSQVVQIMDLLKAGKEFYEEGAYHSNNAMLPHMFGLVEEWGIEGIENDPEKFPGKPLKDCNAFIDWWFAEILKLLNDDEDEKN